MLGLLRNLLGGKNGQPAARKLRHPRDLRAGDIIRFKFLDQQDLSGRQFEVAQVNTYIYDGLWYLEYVLKDASGNLFYLMVEEEDGDEYLALSKKIAKSDIGDMLAQNDMDAVLARGTGKQVTLLSKPAGLEDWLKKNYRKSDDAVIGAFVKGDAREISEAEFNRQEKFTSCVLVSKNDEFALEIEVYNGEVEVCATVYHDIEEIEEMWPGQG